MGYLPDCEIPPGLAILGTIGFFALIWGGIWLGFQIHAPEAGREKRYDNAWSWFFGVLAFIAALTIRYW